MANNATIDVEKLTRVYLRIKNTRSENKRAFEQEDNALMDQQEIIKRALLNYCKEHNVESVRTDSGTFYRSVRSKYWTNDWQSIYDFVLQHRVPEFFSKSLNQTNVKQFLEENPDLRPEGLNIDSEYVVSVRKR